MDDVDLRVTALVEANKWATARGSAGAHPGSKDVLEVAGKFYKYLTGESADSA